MLYDQEYSAERVWLGERYATAWLNYYLYGQPQYFSYLYGDDAEADIQAGRVTRTAQTAPQDVSAVGQTNAVLVSWRYPGYPVIAGYNIYRRSQSGAYSSVPIAGVGAVSSYQDLDVVSGTQYFYVVRSRDASGNEHQTSVEVSAVPEHVPTPTATSTSTVTVTPTNTPSITMTPSPTATRQEFLVACWLPLLLAK